MSVSFSEIVAAIFLCSVITVILYIISWLIYEENNEEKPKEPNTSNLQGLENDKPIPHGEPNEIIDFSTEPHMLSPGEHSTGVVVCEKSDIWRLQDEDFRSRVAQNKSDVSNASENLEKVDGEFCEEQNDPVVHPDSRPGRVKLSLRYDDERSKLIVQVLDGQGLIPINVTYAPEMCLRFTLVEPHTGEHFAEKHDRVFVENRSIVWKEPMTFCVTYENVKKQNLHVRAENQSDPAAFRDREFFVPLNNLDNRGGAIEEWFDLQYIQSLH